MLNLWLRWNDTRVPFRNETIAKTLGTIENQPLIKKLMILQFVKLKSLLPEENILKKANERKPEFEAIPGLLQKYYVKMNEEGSYGGIYVWDTKESLIAFKASHLAKSIPQSYEVIESPNVEIMDILFQLRN